MRRLAPRFVERPWGAFALGPWFPDQDKRTGEVWFDAGPLLIKFLFTTAPLSVQVHPDDAYARVHENSAGKTEMWHILRAEPGARIALGFREPRALDEVRRAAVDGSIEQLMQWWEPEPGDSYFVPAGAVHALGTGLAVCEIQQTSDVTYRLYDYNREPKRELHLERGCEVARIEPHPGPSRPVAIEPGVARVAACEYFTVERWEVAGPRDLPPGVWIVLEGAPGDPLGQPGQVWDCPVGVALRGPATLIRVTGGK